MHLNQIRDEAYDTAIRSGFWSYPKMCACADVEDAIPIEKVIIASRLALVASEVSEALEELRNPEMSQDAFGEELVDIIIRIGDIAAYYHIDLDALMETKLAKNKLRPKRHNKDL